MDNSNSNMEVFKHATEAIRRPFRRKSTSSRDTNHSSPLDVSESNELRGSAKSIRRTISDASDAHVSAVSSGRPSTHDSLAEGKDFSQKKVSGLRKSHTMNLKSGSMRGDVTEPSAGEVKASESSKLSGSVSAASLKWKKLKHSIAFANQISLKHRLANVDVLDEAAAANYSASQNTAKQAPDTGIKTVAERFRPRGRAGLQGFRIIADSTLICRFSDVYSKSLKIPALYFVIVVFSAPLLLAAIFTPLYLLDIEGLLFEDHTGVQPSKTCPFPPNHHCRSIVINVFLYSLSLSTTYGGSRVSAISPFTLILANVNTLMAQFLFVFLSGAVFARMSQPGQPIRCSKKAIIRNNDILPKSLMPDPSHRGGDHKIFAMRLVLVGPPPCELVDVKITLSFRIFLKLPSGSIFASTSNLSLIREDVAYLRFGLMCRHVIDEKSPVFGHTKETLLDGDAMFSISIVGMERTSMQSIFHKQDYYVHDEEVVWDADFVDFIYLNEHGVRVLDHSKLDQLRLPGVGSVDSATAGPIIGRPHSQERDMTESMDGGESSPLLQTVEEVEEKMAEGEKAEGGESSERSNKWIR